MIPVRSPFGQISPQAGALEVTKARCQPLKQLLILPVENIFAQDRKTNTGSLCAAHNNTLFITDTTQFLVISLLMLKAAWMTARCETSLLAGYHAYVARRSFLMYGNDHNARARVGRFSWLRAVITREVYLFTRYEKDPERIALSGNHRNTRT